MVQCHRYSWFLSYIHIYTNLYLIWRTHTDPHSDIETLDIPVNAVATALKDFFSKHLPPLFDKDVMTELEDIACTITFHIQHYAQFCVRYSHTCFLFCYILLLAACIGTRGMPSTTLNMEIKTDRSCRLLALRSLLNKLPPINFSILKYIFQHFVR